ncbi:MAG: hypothetical protein JW963_21585 [Anaerolineales bacterium]|nr:hypothetical protein [Anaerolineales bacterium]
MAKKIKDDIVKRNISLTGEIMRYLMGNPKVFESLPDNFELVILPEDDPEIRMYNLELLDKYGSEGKPIVFARIKSDAAKIEPSIFVPVAA